MLAAAYQRRNTDHNTKALITKVSTHNFQNSKQTSCLVKQQLERVISWLQTVFSVINPTAIGANIPAIVPPVLVIPLRRPANFGAMSMSLMQGPELHEPSRPLAIAKMLIAALDEQPT